MISRSTISGITKRTAAAMCLAAACWGAQAQSAPYKYDMGLALGMSGYIGDANSANIFRHPSYDADISFRYIGDARWSIRTSMSALGLSGNTSDMTNVVPGHVPYAFSSTILDLEVRGEFNFFAYGIGETYKRLRRWTPYITLGVGGAMALTAGKVYGAPVIPMGMGIRYKLAERWNLGAEFTMTKSFSDHFDSPELADLNQIKTAFYKNTDWYSRLTVGISYEFGERCETCHYVD